MAKVQPVDQRNAALTVLRPHLLQAAARGAMQPLTTCLAKPGRAPAPAPSLVGSPRHPRRSVSRHAVAPPQPAVRTAGKSSRAAPSVEAQPELVGVEQGGAGGGAGAAKGYSNNVVAVDAALMPSATHTLPVRPHPVHGAVQHPANYIMTSLILQFLCLCCRLRRARSTGLLTPLCA